MAQTNFTPILTYKSDTATSVPAAGDLTNSANGAELAVNTADKRLFTKDSGGNVVEVGTNPSSLTMSNGTANGVIYANGSKVLTSGSALTFDGTNLSTSGLYVSSAATGRLSKSASTGRNVFTGGVTGGTTDGAYVITEGYDYGGTAAGGAIQLVTAGASSPIQFSINGTEGMRLTSTGLGIGTSSPSFPSGSGLAIYNSSVPRLKFSNSTTGDGSTDGTNLLVSGSDFYIQQREAASVIIATNGTDRATIDSAGNLGLGVTPNAGWSARKVVQLSTGSSFYGYEAGGDSTPAMIANAYWNGSQYIYISSRTASLYYQNAGTHNWFNAASGTAGNAITFTQAMTLDASGNLGVATTSPSTYGKLAVRAGITVNAGTTSLTGTTFFSSDAANSSFWISHSSANTNLVSDSPLTFWGPSGSGVAERARIDSSGNLLVGTTTASGKLFSSTSSASQPALRAASTSATYTDNVFAIDVDRNTTNNTFYVISYYNNGAAAHKFRVADSGNVTNTNNSYGAISDVKLKENIVDATPKLAALQNVRIVNYNRIGSEEKELGVIAQELEQVFPALVETHIDRDAENNDLGTTTKSVKYSVFVPMLIKAIQELKADFDAYKASHP